MLRVQAYIVDQVDDVYKIVVRADGVPEPFTFDIQAKSETEAAMEAIHRVELFDAATLKNSRKQ